MTFGLGIVVGVLIATVLLAGLVGRAGEAGYRNGFSDGVQWTEEGEGYPSKPEPTWPGWPAMRAKRCRLLRPEPGEEWKQ